MKPGKLSVENGLYCLAFFLALGVRFLALGASYLSDQEATWALQALDLAKGSRAMIGAQPGYVLLTSPLFYLFASNNGLARFWPALVGSLLALSPLLFRRQLGKTIGPKSDGSHGRTKVTACLLKDFCGMPVFQFDGGGARL